MYKRFGKRLVDIVVSLIGIVVLFVPMMLVSVLIKIDTSGSIFFEQKRSGKNKVPFVIYKFRTMPMETPKYVASNELDKKKQRITTLQKILRMSSIDELPQLVNILKGDMSIIGPRPVICEEVRLIDERDKYGANSVRPGLTGWAQINGRDNLEYDEKARLDGEYVKKVSFAFDMKCMFMTVCKVLTHDGFNDSVAKL